MDIFASIAIALLLLLGRDEDRAPRIHRWEHSLHFIAAVFSLYNPVRKFALFNNNFQQALGASSEIFRFMDSKMMFAKNLALSHCRRFPAASSSKTSASPTNREDDEARDILHNINLEVRAGEVLAVVGSSGAGKTTLVHLIPRFFDVTGGRLLIDGHDVRDMTLASLRSQIGIVSQDTILFNDTAAQ